ncbi:MAG: hypothetical protein ABI318_22065, partial [Chthoniobacteraceae bacterium]
MAGVLMRCGLVVGQSRCEFGEERVAREPTPAYLVSERFARKPREEFALARFGNRAAASGRLQ